MNFKIRRCHMMKKQLLSGFMALLLLAAAVATAVSIPLSMKLYQVN